MSGGLLKNKYVFYAVFVLAIANVLGYIANQNFESLTLFVAVYILSTYFSKRVVLNLIISMVVAAFFGSHGQHSWPWLEREGLKNSNKREGMKKKEGMKRKEGMKEAASNDLLKEILSNNGMSKENLTGQMDLLENMLKNNESMANQSLNPKDIQLQMKQMEPLIKNAQNLLDTFKNSGILDMIDKISGVLPKTKQE